MHVYLHRMYIDAEIDKKFYKLLDKSIVCDKINFRNN